MSDGAYFEVVRPSAYRAVQLVHQLCGILPSPRSGGQCVDILDHALDAFPRWPVSFRRIHARTIQEIGHAFTELKRERVQAVIVKGDPFFMSQRSRIARLAIRNTLPTVFEIREYAEAGGLMS